MKRIIKKIIAVFIAPLILNYLKSDRNYSYKGISILVKKGVFHPAFFFSSKFLLNHVLKQRLENKKVLELGAGSGLISFHMAKNGALVTATDINKIAIEGLQYNQQKFQFPVIIIESNLFDNIPIQIFDYVLINPPYYPKNPATEAEFAWYCGTNFEYFTKLFSQLKNYINANTLVLMTLSEDCNINQIQTLAKQQGFHFILHKKQRLLWELNFIYTIANNS